MEDRIDRQTSSPPDWNLVQFDVGCARCGCDLRGLSESTCPDCGLEFDWSDAVPLEELTCLHCGYHLYGLNETRCPECGKSFTWEDALAAFRRRKKAVFEYMWREKPVRSLVSTWWLAIRPRKLWRVIDIQDPPQPKPLLAMLVAVLLAVAIVLPPLWTMTVWIVWRIQAGQQGRIPAVDVIVLLLGDVVASRELWCIYLAIALWSVATFVALLVFRQSMQRCKVRAVHVLRVCTLVFLAAVPLLPVVALVVTLTAILSTSPFLSGFMPVAGIVIVPVWAVWLIREAYMSYLRMPHATAVAVASQVIALLAVAVVTMNIVTLLGAW